MKNFQRQDSVTDQMKTVLELATTAGCYDAADWIKARWNPTPGQSGIHPSGATPQAEVLDGRCKAMGRTGQCTKMRGHGQRHRYESDTNRYVAPHKAPVREWTKRPCTGIKSGSRTYVLHVGGPCRIVGERGQWTVVSIEMHPDGRCNVEVKGDRNGFSRTFPLDKVIYKRPKKA